MLLRRLTWIGALFLIPATVHCTADLADGNPCRAIVHAICDRFQRCSALGSKSVMECVDDGQTAEDMNDCKVSTDNARSCASDLSGLSCGATTVPASCEDIAFDSDLPTAIALGNGSSGGQQGNGSGTCQTTADCPAPVYAGVSTVYCESNECVYPGAFCGLGTVTAEDCVCPANSTCTSTGVCICNTGYESTTCNGVYCSPSTCGTDYECTSTSLSLPGF
jgi:hypothetical protein